MSRSPRPHLRNCPLCGLAMQGSKSEPSAPDFDRFDCLTCRTTIVQRSTPPESPSGDSR